MGAVIHGPNEDLSDGASPSGRVDLVHVSVPQNDHKRVTEADLDTIANGEREYLAAHKKRNCAAGEWLARSASLVFAPILP